MDPADWFRSQMYTGFASFLLLSVGLIGTTFSLMSRCRCCHVILSAELCVCSDLVSEHTVYLSTSNFTGIKEAYPLFYKGSGPWDSLGSPVSADESGTVGAMTFPYM